MAQQVAEQGGGLGPGQVSLYVEYLVGDTVDIRLMLVGVHQDADAALELGLIHGVAVNVCLHRVNKFSGLIEPAGDNIALPGIFLRDIRDALGLHAGDRALGHRAEIAEVKDHRNIAALRRLISIISGGTGVKGRAVSIHSAGILGKVIQSAFLRRFSGGLADIGGSGQTKAAGDQQAAQQKGQRAPDILERSRGFHRYNSFYIWYMVWIIIL